MRDRKPVTQTMSASEARQNLSSIVNRVYSGEERVVIERSGIPVAAFISPKDFERFQEFERRRDADFAIIEDLSRGIRRCSSRGDRTRSRKIRCRGSGRIASRT